MSRPWSPQEVEAQVPAIVEALDQAVTDLADIAQAEVDAKYEFERAEAQAWLNAKGPNKEAREAWVKLHEAKPGMTVLDLEYAYDLAVHATRRAYARIRVLEAELDVARTLLVSARRRDS